MTYKGVVTSGGVKSGTTSHSFSSVPRDILAVLFSVHADSPTALSIAASGAIQVGASARTAFGYIDRYSVGLALFICQGAASITLNSIRRYAYAIAHYGGVLWPNVQLETPIFWDNVPKETPVTASLVGGLFLVITGNTTWQGEYSWYPTFSRSTDFNLRNHDCFFTGGIADGGALTVTLNGLGRGDILVFPVRVQPAMVAADVTFV